MRGRHTGWDGDNSVGDFVAEVGLSGLLHLSKDHGGDFLRSEVLGLALVLDRDDRLAVLLLDFEWPVLDVAGDILVVHLATNETLGVKDSVFGIRVEGVLCAVTDTGGIWVSGDRLGCTWRLTVVHHQ